MAGSSWAPGTADGADRILREAQLAYLRRREAFVDAPSTVLLLQAWTDLLVEAADKVEQDQRHSERFVAVGAVSTDDDREWEEAAIRVAGGRWTSD
jgi:hypothetical protein